MPQRRVAARLLAGIEIVEAETVALAGLLPGEERIVERGQATAELLDAQTKGRAAVVVEQHQALVGVTEVDDEPERVCFRVEQELVERAPPSLAVGARPEGLESHLPDHSTSRALCAGTRRAALREYDCVRAPVLLTLGAGAVLLASLALAAQPDELSGADQLRVLYSTQFTFTPEGLPLVPVQLMEGQREVTISALGEGGALRLLPSGEGGVEVVGAGPWRITLTGGRPARVRHWVVVARLVATETDALRAALATWRGRGLQPRTFEVGTVFGVAGEVLDSREVLVVVSPSDDARAAQAKAAELRQRYQAETGAHAELLERPQGTLVATDSRGTVVRGPSVMWFAPKGGGRLKVHRVEFGVGYPNHGFEDRTYFGTVYVTVDREGALAVVNAAPEDKLLAGLVPAEIFPTASMEALKAQAVTARGELLAKIGTRHLVDPYRLCSAQHCQVYSGAGHEHARTTSAVGATRGEVLFAEAGRLVDTVYSAACGGFSEDNDAIWNMRPDRTLRGHLDATGETLKALARFAGGLRSERDVAAFLASPAPAFCRAASTERGQRYRWKVRRSAAELSRLIAAEYPVVGNVRELKPLERGVSGRIRALRIVGDRGEATVRGDFHIRTVLGGLKSTMFVVAKTGDEFVFSGGGFGHGVGMCQTGAIGMAEQGLSYRDILAHYYPGSRLRKLY
jgi:stage II sporulation protein D